MEELDSITDAPLSAAASTRIYVIWLKTYETYFPALAISEVFDRYYQFSCRFF